MGVCVDFKPIFISDEVDEGHFEVIVIGIRIEAVFNKSDLGVTSRMGGGNGPVLIEALAAFLDNGEKNTPRIEMFVGSSE